MLAKSTNNTGGKPLKQRGEKSSGMQGEIRTNSLSPTASGYIRSNGFRCMAECDGCDGFVSRTSTANLSSFSLENVRIHRHRSRRTHTSKRILEYCLHTHASTLRLPKSFL
jgi:hypothetical protein